MVSWLPYMQPDSPGDQNKDTVVLPDSIASLKEKYFPNIRAWDMLANSASEKLSNWDPTQKLVHKYCGCSLLNGRPLDTVIIFMAGETGTGKSTTINNLFDDNDLCKTSSSKSETDAVSVISNPLTIKGNKGDPLFQANLAFVDVPGTFDTNATKEIKNIALVKNFREQKLAKRTVPGVSTALVRENVYPNIVMFMENASNSRILGEDSRFARSLRTFQDTANLVDDEKVNVIVVLTNCMAWGRDKSAFTNKFKETKTYIQQQVFDILHIKNVEVIPIENLPKNYQLKKKGDFFVLPNGDLSHHNLFQAMIRSFERNKDLLGKMLVSHYFGDDCSEKRQKAEVKTFDEAYSATQLAEMQLSKPLETLVPQSLVKEDGEGTFFSFQSMCHGYCPVTEQIKSIGPLIAFENSEMKTEKIGKRLFRIPEFVNVGIVGRFSTYRQTFQSKSDYQKHMQLKYGLAANHTLIVSANLEGKWLKNDDSSGQVEYLSFAHDIELASFKIKNFHKLKPEKCFQQALDRLPDKLSSKTAKEFQNFFSTWGSHIIVEQSVGGSIQEDCVVETSAYKTLEMTKIDSEIKGKWNLMLSGGTKYNQEAGTSELQSLGISKGYFSAVGGNYGIVSKSSVTEAEINKWVSTVPDTPSELKTSIKLLSHYEFLPPGPKQDALRTATERHLCGTLVQSDEETSRNTISKQKKEEVLSASSPVCFPKGALVSVDGGKVEIQNLTRETENLKTLKLSSILVWPENLKVGSARHAKFCTYLDKKDDIYTEYLQLEFDNGKKLNVSPGHMIFQYKADWHGTIVGKQAHEFQIGDKTVYLAGGKVETPQLVAISTQRLKGAYSPLTTTGTLVVDGFLVSSYAHVGSFHVAQAACLPLKVCSRLGIEPSTRTEGTNGLSVQQAMHLGIHPYTKFLMALRKSFNVFF